MEINWPEIKKPSRRITSWEGWPDDVRDILRKWNKIKTDYGWKLTFVDLSYWAYNRPRVFKCAYCEFFFDEPKHGIASFEGKLHCDDCMIEVARGELGKRSQN